MTELTLSERTVRLPRQHPRAFLLLAALTWWILYQSLIRVSAAIVAALPVDRGSDLGSALQFFFYDTPKVLHLRGRHRKRHPGRVLSVQRGAVK